VTLQTGDYNSGAISADGTVYMWGRNDHGQLGLGDERSRWVPTPLSGFRAVHPDRTLRKSKRSLPRMRPIPVEEEPGGLADTISMANNAAKVAFFFPAATRKPLAMDQRTQPQASPATGDEEVDGPSAAPSRPSIAATDGDTKQQPAEEEHGGVDPAAAPTGSKTAADNDAPSLVTEVTASTDAAGAAVAESPATGSE